MNYLKIETLSSVVACFLAQENLDSNERLAVILHYTVFCTLGESYTQHNKKYRPLISKRLLQ